MNWWQTAGNLAGSFIGCSLAVVISYKWMVRADRALLRKIQYQLRITSSGLLGAVAELKESRLEAKRDDAV